MQQNGLPRSLGEYKVLSKLGEGQYGSVYLCKKNLNDYVQYAVKVIDISKFQHHAMLVQLLQTEKVILQKLEHPNILRCYESFQLGTLECLVLHYCDGGDLENYLKGKPPLTSKEYIYFLKQLVNAFTELHRHQIMHRDFKPANVLVSHDTFMIGDFGFASMDQSVSTTKLGTPLYSAPEINQTASVAYNNKVDMWSLGLTFYYIVFLRLPWEVRTKADVLDCSLNRTGTRLPMTNRSPGAEPVPAAVFNLMQRMIEPDPNKRISWDELRRHHLFQANQEASFDPLRSVPIFRSKEVTNSIFNRNRDDEPGTPSGNDWNNHLNILKRLGGEIRYPSMTPSQFPTQSTKYYNGTGPVPGNQMEPKLPPPLPRFTQSLTPAVQGIFDRIYHEKRVSMYFQTIATKVMQAINVVPSSASEVKVLFCNTASLLSKFALLYNAQLMEALLFGDNIYGMPDGEYKSALQMPKMQELIQELTKDNEGQSKQLEQQRGQFFNQDTVPEDIVQILFDDKALLKAVILRITEDVGVINVFYRDLVQLVKPDELPILQEAIAHLNISLSYETQFKYVKDTGLFNWNQFEKNVRDPGWVSYYLEAILKEK